MMRLYMLVEGQTEEEFVKRVLQQHLSERGISTVPIIVTTKRDRKTGEKRGKGGGHWKHWRRDLERLMGEHSGGNVRFTTMFDLYGLPRDFPKLEQLETLTDTVERADALEKEVYSALEDYRLIPYLQRHEFEALVLASLDELRGLLDAEGDIQGLEQLRNSLSGQPPEDINDGEDTAPSKRLASSIASYDKTLHGPLAVEAAGLEKLRKACPRFNGWMAKLEALAPSSPQGM